MPAFHGVSAQGANGEARLISDHRLRTALSFSPKHQMKASFFFFNIIANDNLFELFELFAFYGLTHPIEHEINVISRECIAKNQLCQVSKVNFFDVKRTRIGDLFPCLILRMNVLCSAIYVVYIHYTYKVFVLLFVEFFRALARFPTRKKLRYLWLHKTNLTLWVLSEGI